jgi:hypothetical protein
MCLPPLSSRPSARCCFSIGTSSAGRWRKSGVCPGVVPPYDAAGGADAGGGGAGSAATAGHASTDRSASVRQRLTADGVYAAAGQGPKVLLHDRDLAKGGGWVELPGGLEAKYPRAGSSWAWQWVFPARRSYGQAEGGRVGRHHLHESVVQRAMAAAVRGSGIGKRASCHTCDIPSRPICWRPGTTSGPCRSS